MVPFPLVGFVGQVRIHHGIAQYCACQVVSTQNLYGFQQVSRQPLGAGTFDFILAHAVKILIERRTGVIVIHDAFSHRSGRHAQGKVGVHAHIRGPVLDSEPALWQAQHGRPVVVAIGHVSRCPRDRAAFKTAYPGNQTVIGIYR